MKTETYTYDPKEFKKMDIEMRIEALQAELDAIKAEMDKPNLLTHYELIFSRLYDEYGTTSIFVVNPLEKKANAIIECLEIAHYLNDGWVPDWEDRTDKWGVEIEIQPNKCYETLRVTRSTQKYNRDCGIVFFKSRELCQHFIDHFSDIWLEAIG
jgi:hypothetical protein